MSAHAWLGPLARYRALLSAALDRWDDADTDFAAAHRELGRLGARLMRVRVGYEWGRTLLERGRAEDATRAEALLEGTIAEAEQMGLEDMALLARRRLAACSREPRKLHTSPTASAVSSTPQMALRREGEFWTLEARDFPPVRLKDSRGIQILARLMEAPGQDLHVLNLAVTSSPDRDMAPDGGDAGEWLDEEARREYRERIAELRANIGEAESFADQGRLASARAELEALSSELARAVGLGGRARRAGSPSERARVAVQRRIKDALRRIEEAAPALGRHLARAVYTGVFCSYRPHELRRTR